MTNLPFDRRMSAVAPTATALSACVELRDLVLGPLPIHWPQRPASSNPGFPGYNSGSGQQFNGQSGIPAANQLNSPYWMLTNFYYFLTHQNLPNSSRALDVAITYSAYAIGQLNTIAQSITLTPTQDPNNRLPALKQIIANAIQAINAVPVLTTPPPVPPPVPPLWKFQWPFQAAGVFQPIGVPGNNVVDPNVPPEWTYDPTSPEPIPADPVENVFPNAKPGTLV